MADDPTATAAVRLPEFLCDDCSAWEMSIWEGAAVVRLIPLRMALNFWRIREHTEEGLRVRFYRTRRGVTILSVKAVVA